MKILTVSDKQPDGLYEVTIWNQGQVPRTIWTPDPGLLWVEGSDVWTWAKRHMAAESVDWRAVRP